MKDFIRAVGAVIFFILAPFIWLFVFFPVIVIGGGLVLLLVLGALGKMAEFWLGW